MCIFLIADITITNDDWVPEYAAKAHEIVHKHGGKYLTRSGNITTIEGGELGSSLIAIIEFPTRKHFDAFANDPDYAPLAKARQAGSISRFHIVDRSDLAETIPYLVAS